MEVQKLPVAIGVESVSGGKISLCVSLEPYPDGIGPSC